MDIDLNGRAALVTGAARGMGRAIAQRLHASGARVAVNDLSAAELRDTLAAIGPGGLAVPADLTNADEVRAVVERVRGEFGRLDILVNNAGILYTTRFHEISLAEWNRTMSVNLTALFACTQEAAKCMRAQSYGRIINVSSTAGKTASTLGGAHYTASKTGVLGLTRASAKELAASGITVNAVCPGLIDTEMARMNASSAQLEAYAQSFPIQRLGRPDEVADLVCFLASDRAGYITGASVDINGGDLLI